MREICLFVVSTLPVLGWILATEIITNVHSCEVMEQSFSRQLRYSKCFPGNTMITIKIPDGRGNLPPGIILEEEKYE